MIITLVCDIFGTEDNGTAVVTMNLLRHLQNEGHTVRVLCADQSKLGKENFFVCPNLNFGKKLNSLVKRVGVSLANPKKNIVAAALDGADHVHIMLPLGLGMAAAKMAHKLNIPLTAGFHMQAQNLTSYFKLKNVAFVNKLVYKYIYKHVYRYADGIHYPTDFIRDKFESNIGKKTNGYVISNGVHSYIHKMEVEKPEEYKDKTVILTTGRYSNEKSQDTLIKAVLQSAHKDNIQLILAGQGLNEVKYKKLAQDLPIKPVFKLFSREEMIKVINYCDLYVHPAVDELEGIACLESIACGKMTIVSDSDNSATKDFAVNGKCIFKKRNPKDLARRIDYWIDNPKIKSTYEKMYLESAVVYNQEDCMKEMSKMIYDVKRIKEEKAAEVALQPELNLSVNGARI